MHSFVFLCLLLAGTRSAVIDCDFESVDICGFQQSTTDQLDWRRQSGQTPSAGTGPDDDHTLHNQHGHYVYIESSTPARPGNTAQLVTPPLDGSSPQSCLTFWYSMYGPGAGTLTVKTASATDLSQQTTVWSTAGSTAGDQGPGWHQAKIAISSEHPVKVIFLGTLSLNTATFFSGDMALDDVSVTSGPCDGLGSVTSTTQTQRTTTYTGTSPADCNFERGDLCGYQQLTSTGTPHDDTDWTLTQGPSRVSGTGPDNDHTLGNTYGHYVYISASPPNGPSFHATLVSRPVALAQSCLTFWYSMYGASMGQLLVLTATPHLQNLRAVWQTAGNQGPGWHVANITLQTSSPFEIIFNGAIGNGHLSDIALDDIILADGACGDHRTTATTTRYPSTTTPRPTTTTPRPTTTTPRPTTTTPMPTTTTPTTTTTPIAPNTCQQCEGLQCFTGPLTVTCTSLQPFCSSHVRDFANGERTVVKGCVSLSECDNWTPGDSELQHCLSVDKQVTGHDLDCLFCCHGDLCNQGPSYIPKTDTWVGQNQNRILIG